MNKAVVTGMIATYPVGGVAWDYGQYALALQELGYEVLYLEDTGGPTYHPHTGEDDVDFAVAFLSRALRDLSPGLGERWHYRALDGRCFGMSQAASASFVAQAAVFINVSGSALLRDAYMACPRKVLIDTDPGWNHFVNYPKWDQSPGWQGSHGYRAHDHFFTYAARIGQPDCPLPTMGLNWQPTRPVVVPSLWRAREAEHGWTTVMTWDTYRKPITHGGRTYGAKELEFTAVESLPAHVRAPLEIAVGGGSAPLDRWRELGWSVVAAQGVSQNVEDYRRYIETSRGEFSVAKNIYVATRSGWFSCRSICYLAAGLPVVVQDTGFAEFLPTGAGLMAFGTPAEAAAGINAVEADYARHQRAARELAVSHFSPPVVLGDMLQRIGAE